MKMTKTGLKAFRTTLENRSIELARGNRNREALAIETSSDELDRIQHASDRDWAMGDLERNSDRLREVRDALRRIDAGTFGVCIGCEESINPKRLAAVPWASSCVTCQDLADRERQMPQGVVDTSSIMAA